MAKKKNLFNKVVAKVEQTGYVFLNKEEIPKDISFQNLKSGIPLKLFCPKHQIKFDYNFKDSSAYGGYKFWCKECWNEQKAKTKNEKCREVFVKKAKILWGDTYDYSKTKYVRADKAVEVICHKHGIFLVEPRTHIRFQKGVFAGTGCPKCRGSNCERIIERFLEKNKISYEREKTFEGCTYRRNLKFDFYIPSKKLLVEYQGEQHFHLCPNHRYFSDNEKALRERQKRDLIKKKWVENNPEYSLIKITYKDSIYQKLKDILKVF